jgi:flagella basal body P-ring formation protein FlgA
MTTLTVLALTIALLGPATTQSSVDALRAAIRAAVSERVGAVRAVEIEIVGGSIVSGMAVSAQPAPGARIGQPVRFLVTPASGRPFPVVAKVGVIAGHAVAARAIARGQELTSADVAWKEGSIDGQLLQPLPPLEEVLGARARRAIALGEVVGTMVLAKPLAVRAGDEVALTLRNGSIEARGVGRAVSSGSVGDVIRVTTPGNRDIRRARITAPASVEIVR